MVELIAAVLLLAPGLSWLGAALAIGVLSGAIVSHLTVLGIVVMNDGGLLFCLALITVACCVAVLFMERRNHSVSRSPPVNRSPLIDSAVEVLRQGEALLNALDDESYTRRVPAAFTSAIGGHYRHCLDHFQCLLEGVANGEVNYDHRQRDARIENDRALPSSRLTEFKRRATKFRQLRSSCRSTFTARSTTRAKMHLSARQVSAGS